MLCATAFSLFQVPYIALPAELVQDYDARTRLLSTRVVVLTFAILLFGAGGPALRDAFPQDERLGYLVLAIAAGLVLGPGCWSRCSAHRAARPVTRRRAPSIAENYRLGAAGAAPQPAVPRAAAHLRAAGARDRRDARRRAVRREVGARQRASRSCSSRSSRPALICAPLWAVISRRIGKERAFTIASIIFALAALSLLGLIWAPGPWLYVAGRHRRRRLRGHADAADGDAARRDLARRAHARRRAAPARSAASGRPGRPRAWRSAPRC